MALTTATLLSATLLVIAGLTPLSLAQQEVTQQSAPSEANTPIVEQSAKAPNLVTIRLTDQPLDIVVGMFNRLAGVNLVANPSDLKGTATLNLQDVHWRSALESVLDMHNLTLSEKRAGSEVYTIEPRTAETSDKLNVSTIFLSYAKVEDVMEMIQPMLATEGSVAPFPSRNALVIRSTADNISDLESIVADLDTPRKQVFIEAKFMELNDEAIKDLGVNWQALSGFGLSARNLEWSLTDTTLKSDVNNRGVTASDTYEASDDRILKYAPNGSLLVPPTIEHYTQIPASDPAQYTFYEESEPSRTLQSSTRSDSARTDARSYDNSRKQEEIRTAVFGVDDFRVILSALKQMNGVSIVSNPKIVVANEESAEIHIGQRERPFIASITAGQDGIAPIVTYNPGDPVDFGVKLIVTPTINTSNNITIAIEPELTRFVRDAVAPNGQTFPIIATKKISTIFSLQSGRTVAIGGLTETEEREYTSKIPLLGDIPLIGKYLFSHTHKEMAQKETIIFVTVGLADPGEIVEQSGLPSNTKLTRHQLLREKVSKREVDASVEAASQVIDEKIKNVEALLNESRHMIDNINATAE